MSYTMTIDVPEKVMFCVKRRSPRFRASLGSALALAKAFGDVNAERFVTLVNREPFDYTEWRRDNLFVGETLDDVLDRAERADRRYKERQQAIDAATV